MRWDDHEDWAADADWRFFPTRSDVPDTPLWLAYAALAPYPVGLVWIPMLLLFGRGFVWVGLPFAIVALIAEYWAGWAGYVNGRRRWRGLFAWPWAYVRFHRRCRREVRIALRGRGYPGWPAKRRVRPGVRTLYRDEPSGETEPSDP
jgi:hypothetical protein